MSDCSKEITVKKSRKIHRCEHCGLVIPKGSSYNISSGIFDNEVYSCKSHTECRDAYMAFNKGCDEWSDLCEMRSFSIHQDKIKKLYNVGVKND